MGGINTNVIKQKKVHEDKYLSTELIIFMYKKWTQQHSICTCGPTV
jgi:hypothetical protein